MRRCVAFACMILLISSALAQQPQDHQIVAVGPWHITTTYKADKFYNCTMNRSSAGIGIAFVRNSDDLLDVWAVILSSLPYNANRGYQCASSGEKCQLI